MSVVPNIFRTKNWLGGMGGLCVGEGHPYAHGWVSCTHAHVQVNGVSSRVSGAPVRVAGWVGHVWSSVE